MIEDAELRRLMMLKRLKKYEKMKDETPVPLFKKKSGARTTLIGWGSTYGAINEAINILEQEGGKLNMLHFSGLWPFPAEKVKSALDNDDKKIVIENNATGQLAHLIRAETGIKIDNTILKFDGRPFSPEFIVTELKKEGI